MQRRKSVALDHRHFRLGEWKEPVKEPVEDGMQTKYQEITRLESPKRSPRCRQRDD